jgi:hypothetical protein
MKKQTAFSISLLILMLSGLLRPAMSQERKPLPTENFYTKSLHYTNKGIEFIYSKEQGGLERLTGMSANELGCVKSRCHATSCDVCHVKEANGKAAYSLDATVALKACHECHGELEKDNPDVHFKRGMKCMDCHSLKEIHGDGVAYDTYLQPNYYDSKCERCHSTIGQSRSHTIHKGKVDCMVCHTDETETCLNCHIETRLKTKRDAQVPLKNMLLLINHHGKVTLGNMLSYVYQNKTMITFAPAYYHSIKKEGRQCRECHDSRIVRDIKNRTFKLVRWENGEMKNVEGVIPVLDGWKWDLVYLDRKDTTWIPLKNPAEPLLNYSGSCAPLTQEQFAKLLKAQGVK